MDTFEDPAHRDPVSPFVQLLWERGTLYEADVIRALGVPFTDLSTLAGEAKEAATREAIARGDALIYNGRLTVDELLGEPDLLRREGAGYAAIDIKSGAGEEGGDSDAGEDGKPKKTYGVQIALYTDLLERLGVSAGRFGYIWDVHGEELRYDLDAPLGPRTPSIAEIYREARAEVAATLDRSEATRPAAASVCKQCVWRSTRLAMLKASNDLTLLPWLGRKIRDALAGQFPTVPDLAAANVSRFIHCKKTDFPGVGPETLRKMQARAQLAVEQDVALEGRELRRHDQHARAPLVVPAVAEVLADRIRLRSVPARQGLGLEHLARDAGWHLDPDHLEMRRQLPDVEVHQRFEHRERIGFGGMDDRPPRPAPPSAPARGAAAVECRVPAPDEPERDELGVRTKHGLPDPLDRQPVQAALQDFLDLARTQLRERRLDRPPAAELRMRRPQEPLRVRLVLPHPVRKCGDARDPLDRRAVRGTEFLASLVGRARHEAIP
jgi:hypothetical protein